MALGPHAAFIIASWAVAVVVVAAMIAWVMFDFRRQVRILADLEQRGITRRSAEMRPAPAKEPA